MSRLLVWVAFSFGWLTSEYLAERLTVDSFQALYVTAIVLSAHWIANR
ncbi:hypothetical protein [uncultured Methylophaga sp.]